MTCVKAIQTIVVVYFRNSQRAITFEDDIQASRSELPFQAVERVKSNREAKEPQIYICMNRVG